MKKKIISFAVLGILSLSLMGCESSENKEYKTVSGTIVDTTQEHVFRTIDDYITIKTDSGDVKFKCNEKIYKAVSKDLKVTIKYDDDFYIQSLDFGNENDK